MSDPTMRALDDIARAVATLFNAADQGQQAHSRALDEALAAVRQAADLLTVDECDHTDAYGSMVMDGGPLSAHPGVPMCIGCDEPVPPLSVVR